MKAPSKPESLTIKGADALAFLGAAYLSMDVAYAEVRRKGVDWTVTLLPKSGSAKLAAAFKRDYANQLLRWSVARANRGIRADVLRRALELCKESGGRPASAQGTLPPEQLGEVARLLAEAEADKGPKDPLGITRYWANLREGGK